MNIANILFFIAGTLWAVELFPQLLRTYKTKSVGDICIFYPLICFISFLIFISATIVSKNKVLFMSHLTPFVCNTLFLALVFKYRKKKTKKEVDPIFDKCNWDF